jgi:hypothetical protein
VIAIAPERADGSKGASKARDPKPRAARAPMNTTNMKTNMKRNCRISP